MKLNPEKMKTLVKKASFNYLLGCVQLSFEPDKITSKMMSPNQDFFVSILSFLSPRAFRAAEFFTLLSFCFAFKLPGIPAFPLLSFQL